MGGKALEEDRPWIPWNQYRQQMETSINPNFEHGKKVLHSSSSQSECNALQEVNNISNFLFLLSLSSLPQPQPWFCKLKFLETKVYNKLVTPCPWAWYPKFSFCDENERERLLIKISKLQREWFLFVFVIFALLWTGPRRLHSTLPLVHRPPPKSSFGFC